MRVLHILVVIVMTVVLYCRDVFVSLAKEAARHAIQHFMTITYPWVKTKVIDRGFIAPLTPPHVIRSAFRETPTPAINPFNPSHTHPESGAWRSSLTVMARYVCAKVGLRPFVYQASSVDVRDGFDYSRDYRWAKDTSVPASDLEAKVGDLMVITDVDYYVDISSILLSSNVPVLLYTLQPTAVACSEGEFAFTFDKNNQVHYIVSGGASYKHGVWNYGVDIVSVSNWFTTRYYQVERRRANDHHEYVLLIPTGTWKGVSSLFARFLCSDKIERLKVAFGDYAILDHKTQDGMFRSVGRLGEYNCANVPVKTFDAVASLVKTSTVKVGIASIHSWMGEEKLHKFGASVLAEYFAQKQFGIKPGVIYSPADGMRSYQIVKSITTFEPGHKSIMTAFMSPVYPCAWVPDKSKANEKAAVEGRNLLPKAEAKQLMMGAPTKFLMQTMDEFVKFVVPDDEKHANVLASVEDIYLRQGRPDQRSLLEQADGMMSEPKVKTFLKGESYLKPGDPRLIGVHATVNKRNYARVIYPFADFLLKKEWYAFGKTPREIAEAVASMAKNAGFRHLLGFDANRMDGHHSSVLRDLELMTLLRYYGREYHTFVSENHRSQFDVDAKTKQGVKYRIDDDLASGSMGTAPLNTLCAKFIDYLARRLAGWEPKEAYEADGMFGGDDGVMETMSQNPDAPGGDLLVKAAAMVGQSLEVEFFHFSMPTVNFLSRHFSSNVWNGDPSSTCNMPRALSKLHVTVNLGEFSPLQKLSQKLSGLAKTDRNTPILKEIIAAAERVGLDLHAETDRRLTSWWHQFDEDVNWPNSPIEDEWEFLNGWFPVQDTTALYQYLAKLKRPEELLLMPVICGIDDVKVKPHPRSDVVVDETVIHAAAPAVEEVKDTEALPTSVTSTNDNSAQGFTLVGPRRKVEKLEKFCISFVKGKCNADPCRFPHVVGCREWLHKGTCARGDKCKFKHLTAPPKSQ